MSNIVRPTIIGCPQCGLGKSRTTHTFGAYRAYQTNNTLSLRCKTCSHVQKFKLIRGGYVETKEEEQERLRMLHTRRVTRIKKRETSDPETDAHVARSSNDGSH